LRRVFYAHQKWKSSAVSKLFRDITLGSTTAEACIGQYSQRLAADFPFPRAAVSSRSSNCVLPTPSRNDLECALRVVDPLPLEPLCPTMRAPGSSGLATEVSHAAQERTPRRRLLSRSPVNDGRVPLPSHGSNAERASLAATKSSQRSSAATTHAHVSGRRLQELLHVDRRVRWL
jgi:hypothetical protein